MSAPTFSIVVAAYQAERTVRRAVESVLAQTLDDWELLIVDDGSTDDTRRVALEAAREDARVTVISQKNAGQAAARNTGALRARGTYICVLDADDAYLPNYLERMHELISRHPDCALFSCNAELVRPDGGREPWRAGRRFRQERSFDLPSMLSQNDVFIMAVIDADVFRTAGGFAHEFNSCEDYDLWVRILLAGNRHAYTPEVLGEYYRSGDSCSADFTKQNERVAQMMRAVLERTDLSRAAKRAARARLKAVNAALALEAVRTGQLTSMTRAEALASTAAFPWSLRRVVAVGMTMLSPQWYLSVVCARRNRQLDLMYRTNAEESADSSYRTR